MSPVTVIGGGGGSGEIDLSTYEGDVSIEGNLNVSEEVSAATAAANSAQVGDAGISFGVAQDVSLYRSAADILQSDDLVRSQRALAADPALGAQVVGDTVSRFRVYADGKVEWGAGGVTARDVNLFRHSANILATNDEFRSERAATTDLGFSVQINTDSVRRLAVLADGKIEWGPGNATRDVSLLRAASNRLQTPNQLESGAEVFARVGSSGVVSIGNRGPANEAGLRFGSAEDTNLYRSAADTLRTDDSFTVGEFTSLVKNTVIGSPNPGFASSMFRVGGIAGATGPVVALTHVAGATSEFLVAHRNGEVNPMFSVGNDGKLNWGAGGASAVDVNLYRSAVDILKTDDAFLAAANIQAQEGAAERTRLGRAGPANESGVLFGSAGDTNLYRSAADTLKTDDSLVIGSSAQTVITATGAIQMAGTAGNGYIRMSEQSADPSAPSADRGVIFLKDNGAGKTQLCVRFATGATIVIATEA